MNEIERLHRATVYMVRRQSFDAGPNGKIERWHRTLKGESIRRSVALSLDEETHWTSWPSPKNSLPGPPHSACANDSACQCRFVQSQPIRSIPNGNREEDPVTISLDKTNARDTINQAGASNFPTQQTQSSISS